MWLVRLRLCDGQFNNCSDASYASPGAPSDETDNDGDGYVECSIDAGGWDGSVSKLGGDCEDSNAGLNPARCGTAMPTVTPMGPALLRRRNVLRRRDLS